jgi:hypothetical protein
MSFRSKPVFLDLDCRLSVDPLAAGSGDVSGIELPSRRDPPGALPPAPPLPQTAEYFCQDEKKVG